jgi:hypothetical protein
MNIYLLIAILILIIILLLPLLIYFTNVYENFDSMQYNVSEDIELRDCKLHNIPPELETYCSSGLNYGKLQLINQINLEKDDDLMKVYEYKLANNIFDEPCEYMINKFQEIGFNCNMIYPKKNVGDLNLFNNYGSVTNWASCFANEENFNIMNQTLDGSEGPLKLLENPLTIMGNKYYELSFNNINKNEIREQLCKNNKVVTDSPIIFLKIELTEDTTEPFSKPFKIKNCETIKYDNETNSYETFLENSVYIKSLFAITYDSTFVYYTPIVKQSNIFIMKKTICDNVIIIDTQTQHDFSLAHIGIEKVDISSINRYQISNEPNNNPPTLEVISSFKCELHSEFDHYLETMKMPELIKNKRKNYQQIIRMRNLVIKNNIMDMLSNTNDCDSNINICASKINLLLSNRNNRNNDNEKNVIIKNTKIFLINNMLLSLILDLMDLHEKIINIPLLYSVYENDNLVGIQSINNTDHTTNLFNLKNSILQKYNTIITDELYNPRPPKPINTLYDKNEIKNALFNSITEENEKIQDMKLNIENALAQDISKYKDRNLIVQDANLNQFISQDNCIYIKLRPNDDQCE